MRKSHNLCILLSVVQLNYKHKMAKTEHTDLGMCDRRCCELYISVKVTCVSLINSDSIVCILHEFT